MIMINKFPIILKNKINFITKFGNKSLSKLFICCYLKSSNENLNFVKEKEIYLPLRE